MLTTTCPGPVPVVFTLSHDAWLAALHPHPASVVTLKLALAAGAPTAELIGVTV